MARDNRRVAAEIFPHPRGIVFADIGWDSGEFTGHPFHVIEGELKPDRGGFTVGAVRILEIDEDDPLADDWLDWVAHINAGPGVRATREACLEAIKKSGLL